MDFSAFEELNSVMVSTEVLMLVSLSCSVDEEEEEEGRDRGQGFHLYCAGMDPAGNEVMSLNMKRAEPPIEMTSPCLSEAEDCTSSPFTKTGIFDDTAFFTVKLNFMLLSMSVRGGVASETGCRHTQQRGPSVWENSGEWRYILSVEGPEPFCKDQFPSFTSFDANLWTRCSLFGLQIRRFSKKAQSMLLAG